MKILNEEQKDYLKTLESKKKRRKFFLDCLIQNVLSSEVKSTKISDFPSKEFISTNNYFKENEELEQINRLNSQYFNSNTSTTLGLNNQIENLLKFDILENSTSYGTFDKDGDLTLNTENPFSATEKLIEKKNKLLKFDMLKNDENFNDEVIKIFNSTEDLSILEKHRDLFILTQNFVPAKLFKNKIEMIELIKQMENE